MPSQVVFGKSESRGCEMMGDDDDAPTASMVSCLLGGVCSVCVGSQVGWVPCLATVVFHDGWPLGLYKGFRPVS